MSVENGAYARLADELFAAESARDEARAEVERLREALIAIGYRCHHGGRSMTLTDIELTAARALAGQEFPPDGQFSWTDAAALSTPDTPSEP